MNEAGNVTLPMVLARLALSAVIGSAIGSAQRLRPTVIGVTGMLLVAAGSTGFLLLARHLALVDPTAVSRALQTSLLIISLLGGAVVLTGGTDELRIKTAAAVWMTGAVGLAIATQFWWLGVVTGIATVIILYMTDRAKT
jgi:putative Mg2+ transporter-C (MgtC) family protein